MAVTHELLTCGDRHHPPTIEHGARRRSESPQRLGELAGSLSIGEIQTLLAVPQSAAEKCHERPQPVGGRGVDRANVRPRGAVLQPALEHPWPPGDTARRWRVWLPHR